MCVCKPIELLERLYLTAAQAPTNEWSNWSPEEQTEDGMTSWKIRITHPSVGKHKVSNGGCDRVQAHFSTCQLLTDMVLCVPTFKSYDHQNGIQQNMHKLLRMLEWEHLQRGMKHIYLIFSFRSLTSQQSLWLFIMIKSLKYCPHDEGLTNHTSF